MDVEVFQLIGESVGVQSSDVTLLYVHLETILCKYRSDGWCDAKHQCRRLCLPFVQRIINSSVHASTGASPANLLFGNQLNLNRGILIKVPEESQLPTKASKVITDMLMIQNQLSNMAVDQLTIADKIHISINTQPITIFEVD